jgi:molybdate transport system substrate-binding protein
MRALCRWLLLSWCLACASTHALAGALTVHAAASLKEALDRVLEDFAAESGQTVSVSYAGSAEVARLLIAGAPADLVLTADRDWMDTLAAKGLLADGRRRNLLGNALVVVSPQTGVGEWLDVAYAEAWQEWLGDRPLALAQVDSVPAGRYARAALTALKVWDTLQPRCVMSDNVRATLQLVARAEAALGIVYATDARVEPRVRVVAHIDAGLHPAIVYPLARMKSPAAGVEAADALYDYLGGDAAAAHFRAAGFEVLAP